MDQEISHRSFGDREFIEQRTMTTKTPKSRDAKSRNNQDRLFGRTRGDDRAPSGEAR
jgi:hypothetical protein